MNTTELNIRNHLKSLTDYDIADSVYLFGINFEIDAIDSIMADLNSLYEEVKNLKSMVDSNFKSSQDKVLLPRSRETQDIVIQDYCRKLSALEKALNNEDVYNEFIKYRTSKLKKTSGIVK